MVAHIHSSELDLLLRLGIDFESLAAPMIDDGI
jgi:hypothetical protein